MSESLYSSFNQCPQHPFNTGISSVYSMFLTCKWRAAAGHTAATSPVPPLQNRSTETQHGDLKSPRKPNHSIKPEKADLCERKAKANEASYRFTYLAEFHWRTHWTSDYQSPGNWCWSRPERACLPASGTWWWGSLFACCPGELPWSGCQQSDLQAPQPTPKPEMEAGSPGCHRYIGSGIKYWHSGTRAGFLEQLQKRERI